MSGKGNKKEYEKNDRRCVLKIDKNMVGDSIRCICHGERG